jgi:hypothetical protein
MSRLIGDARIYNRDYTKCMVGLVHDHLPSLDASLPLLITRWGQYLRIDVFLKED